jgi:hypothetical protein
MIRRELENTIELLQGQIANCEKRFRMALIENRDEFIIKSTKIQINLLKEEIVRLKRILSRTP